MADELLTDDGFAEYPEWNPLSDAVSDDRTPPRMSDYRDVFIAYATIPGTWLKSNDYY